MPSDKIDPAKHRLERIMRAAEELRRRAGPDVDRTPITREDFDALWDEPHGDFSKTDIKPAV